MVDLKTKNICLAIVGSRNFTDEKKFKQWVHNWVELHGKPSVIISGGAKGADTLAETYANDNHIQLKIFHADWKTYGLKAGPLRNTHIVISCTHMIAFPSKHGKGTQDSIRKAQKMGKHVTIHYIENNS